MTREDAILQLLDEYPKALFIASTGRISRELFEMRLLRKEQTDDFYMMGSMGCAVGIGLGVAMNTDRDVVVLTGDGALLMKLGSLATVMKYRPVNLNIIVLNNNCHDSTGGQPTCFNNSVRPFVRRFCDIIDVEKKTRQDLGRPTIKPKEITKRFREKVHSYL